MLEDVPETEERFLTMVLGLVTRGDWVPTVGGWYWVILWAEYMDRVTVRLPKREVAAEGGDTVAVRDDDDLGR